MLKRDVETILAAHRLDPDRREVYFEGTQDRLFVDALVGTTGIRSRALLLPVEAVNIPAVEHGGNRGRLLRFAELVQDPPVNILCFADRDDYGVAPEGGPNVRLTDVRDLEGYVLRSDCFARMGVSAGLGVEDSRALLTDLVAIGRRAGVIRLGSHRLGLALPFQRTDIQRAVSWSSNGLEFDVEHYLTALLQNANVSIGQRGGLTAEIARVAEEVREVPDVLLVPGREAFGILDVALRGMKCGVTSQVMWGTFDPATAQEYPVLSSVLSYARGE